MTTSESCSRIGQLALVAAEVVDGAVAVVSLPADAVAVVGRPVVVAAILDPDGPLLRIVLDRLSAFSGQTAVSVVGVRSTAGGTDAVSSRSRSS